MNFTLSKKSPWETRSSRDKVSNTISRLTHTRDTNFILFFRTSWGVTVAVVCNRETSENTKGSMSHQQCSLIARTRQTFPRDDAKNGRVVVLAIPRR